MQDINLRSLCSEEEKDEKPQEWRIVQLGEALKFTKKPRELQYSNYEQIPFIPMELIPIGQMFFEQYILKDHNDISSGIYFEPGDILLAKLLRHSRMGNRELLSICQHRSG